MKEYYVKTSGLCCSGIALILLILPVLAAAGPEDVINKSWSVTVSKVNLSKYDCDRETCLKKGDRFRIEVEKLSSDGDGKGQLIIERRPWNVNFDALVRVNETDQQFDYMDVFFLDRVPSGSTTTTLPLKRMRIRLVDRADMEACKERFKELDRGAFEEVDFEAACPSDGVDAIHWSICSLDPTSNCDWFDLALNLDIENFPISPRAVPDDGQGAGGPPN